MDEIRERIKKYFSIDVTEEGVSNKFAVTLRILGCVVILYSIIGCIYCLFAGLASISMLFLTLALIYFALLHIGKNVSNTTLLLLISIVDIASVIIGFIFMGPRALFQIYLFILIMLVYFANYGRFLGKAVYSFFVGILYIVITILAASVKPLVDMTNGDYIFIQIINILCSFLLIIIICTVFSMDSQMLEGKLLEFNKMLQKQAATDPLTGLCNRRSGVEFIGNLIKNPGERGFCVCMCDIDFFKKVNDSYGHDIGDNVLRGVARTMLEGFPKSCLISRWGGEEFLVIFPNMNGDDAKMILDVMRAKVKKLDFYAGEKKFNITVTYGLAEYGYRENADELVKEADKKLYIGKENGRDQVVY